jgi:hypothetical protein
MAENNRPETKTLLNPSLRIDWVSLVGTLHVARFMAKEILKAGRLFDFLFDVRNVTWNTIVLEDVERKQGKHIDPTV